MQKLTPPFFCKGALEVHKEISKPYHQLNSSWVMEEAHHSGPTNGLKTPC